MTAFNDTDEAYLVCLDCGHYWLVPLDTDRCEACGCRDLRDYDVVEDAEDHSEQIMQAHR